MANADNEEDELTRLAVEELTKGAKRGKEREETMGSLAWKSRRRNQPNKRYLNNTVIGAVQSNKRIEKKSRAGSSRLFAASLKDLKKNEKPQTGVLFGDLPLAPNKTVVPTKKPTPVKKKQDLAILVSSSDDDDVVEVNDDELWEEIFSESTVENVSGVL